MKKTIETEYSLGQVVKHKYLDFRGVIYDVDPEFNNINLSSTFKFVVSIVVVVLVLLVVQL